MNLKMKSMMTITRSSCTVIAMAIALAGCAETQRPQATGKANIRAINAIVTAPDITFRVEERAQGQLGYGSGAAVRFDDLPYNVNFDVLYPNEIDATRIASQPVDTAAGMEYIVSVTGSLSAASTTVWEHPERMWEGNETVFEASFGHLSGSIGEVDVYLEPTGISPAAGNARGTIGKGGFIPASDFTAGDYQLFLTAKGDPATIIYASPAHSTGGAVSITYVIFTADPSHTGPAGVRRMPSSGGSLPLPDQNSPPTIRTYHAAFGTGNYDAYLNGDFDNAVASDIGFGGLSTDADGIAGENTVTFTDAGNAGATLLEQTITVTTDTRRSVLLAGAPAGLLIFSLLDDRRPEETIGKLRFVHAATNAGTVDMYFTLPGTDITNTFPTLIAVASMSSTAYAQLVARTYDVTITPTGEKTVLAELSALDFTSDGIAELILLDTADPGVVTLTDWSD